MKKERWLGLQITLAFIVLLVSLPVALPVVLVLATLDGRRMRATARKFVCLSCGSCLGAEATQLADKAWERRLSERLANNHGVRLHILRERRIVRPFCAICPHCGARYGYVERDRTFVLIGDDCW